MSDLTAKPLLQTGHMHDPHGPCAVAKRNHGIFTISFVRKTNPAGNLVFCLYLHPGLRYESLRASGLRISNSALLQESGMHRGDSWGALVEALDFSDLEFDLA